MRSVTERPHGFSLTKRFQYGAMGDTAEGDNCPQRRKHRDLGRKKRVTGVDLLRYRPVFWRHAANGIGDATSDQPQAVIRFTTVLTVGPTMINQRRIKQVTGIIARERTACSVCAPHPRRKADNQQ